MSTAIKPEKVNPRLAYVTCPSCLTRFEYDVREYGNLYCPNPECRCMFPPPKQKRKGGRGCSGSAIRSAASCMITATPALSSLPKSVVPSLEMTSCPTCSRSAGLRAGSSLTEGSPGKGITEPS